MKRKLVSTALIMSFIATLMSGCGGSTDERFKGMSTAEIIAQYDAVVSEKDQIEADYNSLQVMYSTLTSEDAPTNFIGYVGDGSNRFTFNSVDSKIIFPASFQYPASEQVAASGSINIVNEVSVTPGSNWIVKLAGSTLELEHSSGISAIIKVGGVQTLYNAEELQADVLEPWFENIPESSVTYQDIFIDTVKFGSQAITPTMINSENAVLRCGMVGYGSNSVTYVFVYRGDQDLTKDESILNVINSISINGVNLTVEA